MRVFTCLGLAALVILAGTGTPRLGAQSAATRPDFVTGELIVKYRAGAQPASRGRARAAAAVMAFAELARAAAARGHGRTELVRLSRGASMQAARRLLQSDPAVEYAEPNWILRHQAAPPDDPRFGEQWALENTGQTVAGTRGIADADIDALQGWSAIANGDRAYVGVLDEGIDFSHPDLGVQPGGPIWTNPFDPADGRDNDGNGYIDDVHGWD